MRCLDVRTRLIAALCATTLHACASRSGPPAAAPAGSGATAAISDSGSSAPAGHTASPQGVRVAQIHSKAPDQPFLDLGPIVVRGITSKKALIQRLQLEADRLDADGFIVETETLSGVYHPDPERVLRSPTGEDRPGHRQNERAGLPWGARDFHEQSSDAGTAAVFAATALVTGIITHNFEDDDRTTPGQGAFLRGFRFVDAVDEVKPTPLPPNLDVPAALRQTLESAASLQDQILALTREFLKGELSVRSYEKIRFELCRS